MSEESEMAVQYIVDVQTEEEVPTALDSVEVEYSENEVEQEIPVQCSIPDGEDDDTEISIPCRLCKKQFANPVALRNHVNMHHPENNVDVSTWIWEFVNQEQDEDECVSSPIQISVVEEKPKMKTIKQEPQEYKCYSGPFVCHQQSSTNSEGVCNEEFSTCCEYSMHYRDEHTMRRKPIRCQVCERVLNTSDGGVLLSPYTCLVCGAGFASHSQLASHTSSEHAKLKPFSCNLCHKRFTQATGLNQHMRLHTGDRPFPCLRCDKAFTQKAGLDQHMRIHTKVKPYHCLLCSKSFCQSVHLKQHMRTHTNITPFECNICQKKFKQLSQLNYHQRHHAEEKSPKIKKEKVYVTYPAKVKSEQELTVSAVEYISNNIGEHAYWE